MTEGDLPIGYYAAVGGRLMMDGPEDPYITAYNRFWSAKVDGCARMEIRASWALSDFLVYTSTLRRGAT